MKLRLIFDVHGKPFEHLLKDVDYSIQIGDLGFNSAQERFKEKRREGRDFCLFGNHDDYTKVYEDFSLFDYSIIDTGNHRILCVRGANSIDKQLRTPYRSWWPEEQLTFSQGYKLIKQIENEKFDIVISHECPEFVKQKYFNFWDNRTTTGQLLNVVYQEVNPDMWFFGHYHEEFEIVHNSTYFKCGPELTYVDLDIDDFKLTKRILE